MMSSEFDPPYSTNPTIYVAESLARVGVKDPLKGVFTTPPEAYAAIVDHAGHEPESGEPEWPDSFGGDMWGWNPPDGETPSYLISEWVPADVGGEDGG